MWGLLAVVAAVPGAMLFPVFSIEFVLAELPVVVMVLGYLLSDVVEASSGIEMTKIRNPAPGFWEKTAPRPSVVSLRKFRATRAEPVEAEEGTG